MTAVCLSRARTATFASTGTQPLCARYRQGAISTFLTIRILRTFCPRQCIEDLRPCTSSQECAPFELALSRAGEQSTGARVSQAHHVGSSSVSTDPYSGWTKSLCKWPHPASPYTRSLKLLVYPRPLVQTPTHAHTAIRMHNKIPLYIATVNVTRT